MNIWDNLLRDVSTTAIIVLALAWLVFTYLLIAWFRQNVQERPEELETERRYWEKSLDELHPLSLGCIDCRGELERLGDWYGCRRCGLTYAPEQLAGSLAESWFQIQSERLFCYVCPPVIAGQPVIYRSRPDGPPIPCPLHGPAPKVRVT
jgi:hypothetical protein